MHLEKSASQSQLLNLDKLAMETALELAHGNVDKKKLENLSTKALGVLQEQGIFAMMLFLFSEGSDTAKKIAKELYSKAMENIILSPNKSQDKEKILESVAEDFTKDLHRLLLIRDFYQLILTYLRYIAKGLQ